MQKVILHPLKFVLKDDKKDMCAVNVFQSRIVQGAKKLRYSANFQRILNCTNFQPFTKIF